MGKNKVPAEMIVTTYEPPKKVKKIKGLCPEMAMR